MKQMKHTAKAQRQLDRTWRSLQGELDFTRRAVQDPLRYAPREKRKPTLRQKLIIAFSCLAAMTVFLCCVFVIPFRCDMRMTVRISAAVTEGGSVGEEWKTDVRVNGIKVRDGGRVTVTCGRPIRIETILTEQDDARKDVSTVVGEHFIALPALLTGFTVRDTVAVVENGGRYTGSEARVTLTYCFER